MEEIEFSSCEATLSNEVNGFLDKKVSNELVVDGK